MFGRGFLLRVLAILLVVVIYVIMLNVVWLPPSWGDSSFKAFTIEKPPILLSIGETMFRMVEQYEEYLAENDVCASTSFDGYGVRFIEQWRAAHMNLCSGDLSGKVSPNLSAFDSSIDCYAKTNAPVPMTLCTTTNSQVLICPDPLFAE